MSRIFLNVFFLFIASNITAQTTDSVTSTPINIEKDSSTVVEMGSDTLLKINGKTYNTAIVGIDSSREVLYYLNPKRPHKYKKVEFNDVFSVTNKKGKNMYYKQDTLGNDYSVPEMRYFILGEQEARMYKKPKAPFIINFIVSSAAGLTGSQLSPIVPLIFTGIIAIPKPRVKEQYVSNSMYLDEPAYVAGYKYEAARKRRMSSVLGGGIGLIGGIIASLILDSQGIDIY